jgi:WhiB family redox-sensing transcriptional regulator
MSGGDWSDFAGLVKRPEWQQRAACQGVGSDIFFGTGRGAAARAMALCRECPVARECRSAALEAGEVGVWGGTTAQQRKEGQAA